MLAYQPHAFETAILMVWAAGCLVGGILFLVIGARAIGLALLGALAGAFFGAFGASTLDAVPSHGAVGATIGTFVAGSAGLAWKPSASRSFLKILGLATVVVGTVVVLGIHLAAARRCHHGGLCLPSWSGGADDVSGISEQVFLASDMAFLVFLCLWQARQASKLADGLEHADAEESL